MKQLNQTLTDLSTQLSRSKYTVDATAGKECPCELRVLTSQEKGLIFCPRCNVIKFTFFLSKHLWISHKHGFIFPNMTFMQHTMLDVRFPFSVIILWAVSPCQQVSFHPVMRDCILLYSCLSFRVYQSYATCIFKFC